MASPYLLDIPAIKEWAAANTNESQVVLDAIRNGEVVVYNRIWESANDAYPDECKSLPKGEFKRERCTEEHRLAAAAVADKLQATFPIKGTHDDAIEWIVVGIAISGPYTVVTDERRKKKYEKINGLTVITYEDLIEEL